MNVLGIVGSLRAGSYNRALINAFDVQKPEGTTMTVADISTLPFYNEDTEAQFPEAGTKTRVFADFVAE